MAPKPAGPMSTNGFELLPQEQELCVVTATDITGKELTVPSPQTQPDA